WALPFVGIDASKIPTSTSARIKRFNKQPAIASSPTSNKSHCAACTVFIGKTESRTCGLRAAAAGAGSLLSRARRFIGRAIAGLGSPIRRIDPISRLCVLQGGGGLRIVIAAAHTVALAADNLDDAFVGAPFDHGRGLLGRYGLEDLGAGMLKDF